MIFSFVTWSNFLHGNEAPSNHSFYDKFTLIPTYIIIIIIIIIIMIMIIIIII